MKFSTTSSAQSRHCLGVITLREFTDVCSFLSNHGATKLDEQQIHDLASSIDLDKNGVIDFNEFLEAFRMVDLENSVKNP